MKQHYKINLDDLTLTVDANPTQGLVQVKFVKNDSGGKAKGLEAMTIALTTEDAQALAAGISNAIVDLTPEPDDAAQVALKTQQRTKARFERMTNLKRHRKDYYDGQEAEGRDDEWDPTLQSELDNLTDLHEKGEL